MRETFDASGPLASVDVPAALCAVARGGVSGTLRIAGPAGETVRFGFDSGVLVALEPPPEISPAEVLIRAGKIQRATYEALTVGDFEDRFAVAAASGVVSRRETNWGLKISAIESLSRVLSWREGTYAFEEGPPEPTAPPLRLAVEQWILELFLRSNDRAFVVQAIGPTDVPVARSAGFAEGFAALGLTADADAVVEGIDGRRTIDQVVRRSRADEFATLKLLAALMVLGLVRPIHELPAGIGPGEAPAPASAETAPEAEWELAEAPAADAAAAGGAVAEDEGPGEEPAREAVPPPPEPAEAFPEPEPGPEPRREPELEPAAPEAGGEAPAEGTSGGSSGSVPLPEISVPLFALTAPDPEEIREPEADAAGPAVLGSRPQRRLGAIRAAAVLVAAAAIAGAILLRRRAAPRAGTPAAPPAAAPRPAEETPRSAAAASPRPQAGPEPSPERTAPISAPAAGRRREPEKPPTRPATARPPAAPSPAATGWEALARAGRRTFEHPGAHRYAIQLELACEEATLRKAFDSDPGRRSIWIAPYEFRGRSCYRVLWGKYRDLAAAKSAKSTLPAIFSEGGNRPAVVSLGRAK